MCYGKYAKPQSETRHFCILSIRSDGCHNHQLLGPPSGIMFMNLSFFGQDQRLESGGWIYGYK